MRVKPLNLLLAATALGSSLAFPRVALAELPTRLASEDSAASDPISGAANDSAAVAPSPSKFAAPPAAPPRVVGRSVRSGDAALAIGLAITRTVTEQGRRPVASVGLRPNGQVVLTVRY